MGFGKSIEEFQVRAPETGHTVPNKGLFDTP